MEDVDLLINEYQKSVKDVFELAYKHLSDNELRSVLLELAETTASIVINKWKTRKKVIRTFFATKTFPKYPQDCLAISLYIDATVNVLDDIHDELMSKYERTLHIVEFSRIFSLIFSEMSKRLDCTKIAHLMSEYFSKILCVATSEIYYGKLIHETTDFEKITNYAIKCYNYRAMDVDIFFEIPMIKLYGKVNYELLNMARTFRAVNLILKDYKDIPHDLNNETFTPLVAVYKKDYSKLQEFIEKLLNYYYKKSSLILENNKNIEIKNLFKMIEEEIEKWKLDQG